MKIKLFVLALLIGLICTACSLRDTPLTSQNNPTIEADQAGPASQTPTLIAQAESALIDCFSALNQGEYAKAASLYGGSYELLQSYNPTLDSEDHAALLKAGCEFNGLMCRPIKEVLSVQTSNPNEIYFEVEFANPDGSTFVLGPCCGETEETMPPLSAFMIEVRCQEDGDCQVQDLPPYVP
jgi:hypothetical protein